MDKSPTRSVNHNIIDTRDKNSRNTKRSEPCIFYKMGRCFKGETCKFAHVEGHQINVPDNADDDYNGKKFFGLHGGQFGGKIELLDQTGVQHGDNSTFRSQSATAPPHEPYRRTANVTACDQVNLYYGTPSATASPYEPYRGTANVSACDQVNSYYGTPSVTVDPGVQNCIFLHVDPDTQFKKIRYWKTKICPKWQKGYCLYGSICKFAHGDHELRDQRGSQNALNSYPMTEFVAPPPHGSYHTPANVSASDQANRISRTESATAPPRGSQGGTISNIVTQSATADPLGAYHGTANVSSRGHKNMKHPFNWDPKKKIIGIYGDWLDDEEEDDKTIQ